MTIRKEEQLKMTTPLFAYTTLTLKPERLTEATDWLS